MTLNVTYLLLFQLDKFRILFVEVIEIFRCLAGNTWADSQ